MRKEDCIIYKGIFFQIEWYYDAEGKRQPYDYYESCDLNQKRKFLMLCQRIGDTKTPFKEFPKSKSHDFYFCAPLPWLSN